jgi:hypothetical protein
MASIATVAASLALVIVVQGCGYVVSDEPSTTTGAPHAAETRPETDDGPAVDAPRPEAMDAFGIRQIHPTIKGGMRWTAKWDRPRRFSGVDPRDPWFDADHGEGRMTAAGGRLRISGDIPRMYVHDPQRRRQWRDVEVTMYFKRVADAGVDYAGMVSVVRTNHGVTGDENTDVCDTRGLSARMRYDGRVDFDKETAHPASEAAAGKRHWRHGLPRNRWIGYKHIVYDLPNGDVRQTLWIDTTNGRGGGDWRLIDSLVDDGDRFGDKACADGIDPEMPLTNAPNRRGSESGLPNLSVYFRSDRVEPDGLVYKWGSIREIEVCDGRGSRLCPPRG